MNSEMEEKTCILHSPSILKHILGVQDHSGTLQKKAWFTKKLRSLLHFRRPPPFRSKRLRKRKRAFFFTPSLNFCCQCTKTRLKIEGCEDHDSQELSISFSPYFSSSFSTWPPIVINFVPWNIWDLKWNHLNQIAISKHSLFQLRSWKVKCVAWFETNGFRFPLCKQTPLKSSLQSWGKPVSKGRLQKPQSQNLLGGYPTPASTDRISPINQQKSFMDQGGTVLCLPLQHK